ncbi:MAG: type II secretion system protein [Bacilli bacterium]|nr:type II secretion system protein [Bacilli bacterium]
MKNNNNKGFTLIELLAVIIILGVLMMTAIPAVTKYIENSRKDTFWQTAKSYIDAARTPLLNDELLTVSAPGGSATSTSCPTPTVGKYIAIDISSIDLEKGKGKSSFNRDFGKAGTTGDGYVLAVNNGTSTKDNIVYYFVGIDKGNNGIETLTLESNLKRASVKKGNAKKATAIDKITNKTAVNLPNMSGTNTNYSFQNFCTTN